MNRIDTGKPAFATAPSQSAEDPARRHTAGDNLRRMAAASLAGGVAEGVLTSWLRVATIERQLLSEPPPLTQHLRQLGGRALVRGMGLYTVNTAVTNLACFTLQRAAQDALSPPRAGPASITDKALAGALAGGSEALLTNPLRALLVAMSTQAHRHQTASSALRQLVAERGFMALSRGASASAARNAVSSSIFFPLVAGLRETTAPYAGRDLVCGAAAGAVASALVAPLDVVAASQSRPGHCASLGATALGLWRKHGLAPFFHGVSTTAARAALATGITYFTTMRAFALLGGDDSPHRAC